MIGGVVFDQSYRGSQSLFVIGDKNKHFHDDCALTDVLIAASCGKPTVPANNLLPPTSTFPFFHFSFLPQQYFLESRQPKRSVCQSRFNI